MVTSYKIADRAHGVLIMAPNRRPKETNKSGTRYEKPLTSRWTVFTKDKQKAGHEWPRGSRKCNRNISLRVPEADFAT